MTRDERRKRLLYVASHRGTKEADLFIGGFARSVLSALDGDEMAEFERIVELPCADLMDWAMGKAPVPPAHDGPLMRRLLAYKPELT